MVWPDTAVLRVQCRHSQCTRPGKPMTAERPPPLATSGLGSSSTSRLVQEVSPLKTWKWCSRNRGTTLEM